MQKLEITRTWQGDFIPQAERAQITLSLDAGGLTLSVKAPFHGDYPPPKAVGSTEKLWEYEVVEVFLVDKEGSYLEIEMGPYGHYLLLQFKDVRCVEKAHLPMDFTASISESTWQGEARILKEYLPLPCIRANAFAIHGSGEKRRYLCAHPTGGKIPDFHQPGTFPSFSF